MRRTVLPRIGTVALAGIIIIAIGTAGCKRTTRVVYSPDAWRMVPLVLPGEVVDFSPRIIKWIDNPCVDPTNPTDKPCEIRKQLTGYLFKYECADSPCDPEIAVDDPIRVYGTANLGPSSPALGEGPTYKVELRCVMPYVDPEGPKVGKEKTVGWGGYGTGVKPAWYVKFDGASPCNEGDTFKRGEHCTIKSAAESKVYPYTAYDLCTDASLMPKGALVVE